MLGGTLSHGSSNSPLPGVRQEKAWVKPSAGG